MHTCGRQADGTFWCCDGTLWCWGSNFLGQIGAGGSGGQLTPVLVCN